MNIPDTVSFYALLGFAISSATVALAYMLGKAWKKPKLVGWAMAEKAELIKTAFIFLAVLGFEVFLSVFTQAILEDMKVYERFELNKGDPPTLAVANLYQGIINNIAFPVVIKVAEYVHQLEFFKGAAESWAIAGAVDVKLKAYAGIAYREPPMKWALTLLTLTYTSLNIQRAGLFFLHYAGQILLLGALALRPFKPLREAADHTIAMVLAYTFLFPFFTLLFFYMFDETLLLSKGKHFIDVEAWHKGEGAFEWLKEVGYNVFQFALFGFPPYLYSGRVAYGIYESVAHLAAVGFIVPTFSLLVSNAGIKNFLKVLKMEGFGGLSL